MKKNIFERSLAGEPISLNDPENDKMQEALEHARIVTSELNTSYHEPEEALNLIRLLGAEIDKTAMIRLPFYTDFGKFIRIGKHVFINQACIFMDRGGITIEENTKIGPRVNLITENHGLKSSERHILTSRPIFIGRNVWIGAAATVLPGVTIGENSVVAAGAVVSRDVPPNTVVARCTCRNSKRDSRRINGNTSENSGPGNCRYKRLFESFQTEYGSL